MNAIITILNLQLVDCGSNTSTMPSFFQSPLLKHNYHDCHLIRSNGKEHVKRTTSFFSTIQELKSLVLVKCITCLVVMHPVQHDLRSPVPPGSHIPGHLIICVSGQAKIQDLQKRKDIHKLLQYNNAN